MSETADFDFFAEPFPAVIFDEGRDHHLERNSGGGILFLLHDVAMAYHVRLT